MNNLDNLVTVVMPAYNAANYVLDAIESIRQQRYEPIEILLIDDGSTDNTVELVRSHAPEVVIIQQTNAGASAARNTGLLQAKGQYICFLDADDGWFEGKLAAQVDYLQRHPEVGIVYHTWLVWKPEKNGQFIPPKRPEITPSDEIESEKSGWLYCKLLLDCLVHTSTVMLRRTVREEIGYFDTALEIGEDYDYWLRVSRYYQIHKLAGTYSFYRATPGSLTTRPKQKNYEYAVISSAIARWGLTGPDNFHQSQRQIKYRLHKSAYDFACSHLINGSPNIARYWFSQSLRHRISIRSLIYTVVAAAKSAVKR